MLSNCSPDLIKSDCLNLFQRINVLVEGYHRNETMGDLGVGLLLVDIKGFRKINSVFGFAQGDRILADTMLRLTAEFSQNCDVLRAGNDEFALLLTGLINPNVVNLAANKVIRVLSEPVQVGHSQLTLGLNIGSAYQPANQDSSAFLSRAEASLALAKSAGKTYDVTEFGVVLDDAKNLNLESELHEALTKNTLELYYQPKVDLVSRIPTHVEALARWTSPSIGPVSPFVFVPIIEQMGRMEELTKWAVNTALRQRKEWPKQWGELSVAVNVCASLVDSPQLLDFVDNAIAIWDSDPALLTLEITEGSIIQDRESSFANLSRIKSSGVNISIDDFGTGYSSLAYFKNIPADELKIDKSFVLQMLENEGDKHITQVVIDLAHKFNLSVVAEGVETKEILYALMHAQCDYAQGYYFSKPLPQDEFMGWLDDYDAELFF